MKYTSLINAINKAGLKVTQPRPNCFKVIGPNSYYGTFIKQNDSAICVAVNRKGDVPDNRSDYFPATFCDTIKGFMAKVQE